MTGMVGVPFGMDDLRGCLASVAPVELKGMRLLETQPHLIAGTARIPRAELVEAVTEIVAYTGRCASAARQLASLPPVPLLSVSIPEFGL